jgi:two-component system OmpR family response regulator
MDFKTRVSLKKILYVEDEADIQFITKTLLQKNGFFVEACSLGAEALQKVSDFQPDLLLLDVMMPQMDGPATLQELRKLPETSSTPVMFMTAKVQKTEQEIYSKLGAIGVISKPFDPMTFVQTLTALWDQAATKGLSYGG